MERTVGLPLPTYNFIQLRIQMYGSAGASLRAHGSRTQLDHTGDTISLSGRIRHTDPQRE
jgi:hypothetical protein